MATTTSMTTKTAMTTRTGASALRRSLLALLFPAALLAAGVPPDKEKKPAAVIAGTVFRDPGFTLPGAQVELIELRTDGKKPKVRKSVTDARGEFAFSVPPEDRKYIVKASAKGLQTEEKETASTPGARIDVFLTLKPASQSPHQNP
jgi:hypothetical protein